MNHPISNLGARMLLGGAAGRAESCTAMAFLKGLNGNMPFYYSFHMPCLHVLDEK